MGKGQQIRREGSGNQERIAGQGTKRKMHFWDGSSRKRKCFAIFYET